MHLARTGEVRKKPGVGVCFLVFLTRPPTLSTLPILATEAYLCARLASETTELAFLCGYLLGIIKTKPANSPSNFGHETPRAHLRFRCDLAPWLPPLSPSHGELIHPQGWPWRRPQQGWPAYRLLAGEELSRRSSRSERLQQEQKNC